MRDFPRQPLSEGKAVYFGQNIQEVEALFGISAIDNPLRIARKGIDRLVSTPQFKLEFDTGKLRSIEFREPFNFACHLQPFADSWPNFGEIDGICIEKKMTRDRFVDFVRAWEARAKVLGAIAVDSPDLEEGQFRYAFDKDRFSDMFHLAVGPSRRAGGGGIWSSGWTAFFSMEADAGWNSTRGSELKTVTAFCDEFNTVARKALE